MEVWGATADRGPYRLMATFPITAMSGTLGPKRREGDLQAPEGFYQIDKLDPNPKSHLALGLNYPNSSDRKLGSRGHLDKDVFVHGNHVSAGCFALPDSVVDKIYRLAVHAKGAGQAAIPVSIFPCRMTHPNIKWLEQEYVDQPGLIRFWGSLEPGYRSFERTHLWPQPQVDRHGLYAWSAPKAPIAGRRISNAPGTYSRSARVPLPAIQSI